MMNTNTPPKRRTREGNTMVLVVGILALLVIIATGYVTRTHSGRLTSSSQQQATQRDDSAHVIGESIAIEIAEALFVRPVDPLAQPPVIPQAMALSDDPRWALRPLDLSVPPDGVIDYVPVRYGVDPVDYVTNSTSVPPADGIPDRPYNVAPYAVYPWTNWPDQASGPSDWPKGTGAPDGIEHVLPFGIVPLGEGNPAGNPGFGDTRWLASFEPVRITASPSAAFSHWTHLSYIAGPHNGWRLVTDISDVFGAFSGGLLLDLGVPVEQWLPFRPQNVNAVTGGSVFPSNFDDFINQWSKWFGFEGYRGMYANFDPDDQHLTPPANFYDLSDLFDDGSPRDPGERVQDEFEFGTPRWNVSRVLADADGDGFTDSFWFLVPSIIEGGIRQIVAVRIIDNSAMLNANAATRFVRADQVALPPAASRGITPTDLALAGDLTDPEYTASNALQTGFFDNPQHHEDPTDPFIFGDTSVGWDPGIWALDYPEPTFLGELGVILPNGDPHLAFPNLLGLVDERLRYWQFVARDPENATGGLTPFTIADELELRMFHGQNVPWNASRFERAVQANVRSEFNTVPGDSPQILRGNLLRVETSEYLQQLTNRQLVLDSRHRLTLFSGARNDIMPPWLWPDLRPRDFDGDNFIGDGEFRQFHAGARKFDLRFPWTVADVDRDGVIEMAGVDDWTGDGTRDPSDDLVDDDINDDGVIDERDHIALLVQRLRAALVLDDTEESYFDDDQLTPSQAVELTERLAASYAANFEAWVDGDALPPVLDEAVEWVDDPAAPTKRYRYIGMEPQPFLVESFIAHVQTSFDPVTMEYLNPIGGRWAYAGLPGSTIVVVQIANPFDQRVDISDFKVRVFGKDVRLDTLTLPMNMLDPGESVTLYSMVDSLAPREEGPEPFKDPWTAALGLDPVIDFDVTDPVSGWSVNRNAYELEAAATIEEAVELVREVPLNLVGDLVDVVIDRMDIHWQSNGLTDLDFVETVKGFDEAHTLLGDATAANPPVPPFTIEWTWGTNIGSNTHWVQWASAKRAWTRDAIEPENKINPRYVFAGRVVETTDDSIFDAQENGDLVELNGGAILGFEANTQFPVKQKDVPAVTDELCPPPDCYFSLQMLQKGGDIEQLGEMGNIWLFGHELEVQVDEAGITTYLGTHLTFSEYMWDEVRRLSNPDDKARVNRLRARPARIEGGGFFSPVLGHTSGLVQPSDPLHLIPDLPAGARVFDAFVCDGVGIDGVGTDALLLANGYSGRATPGLINVNTAPPEVMRAVPHGSRLVHEVEDPTLNPFVRLGEGIVQYRERYNGDNPAMPLSTGLPDGPDYAIDRGSVSELRGERGFVSLGELMLVNKPAVISPGGPVESWQVDFAGLQPYGMVQPAQLSTDLVDVFDPASGTMVHDLVAEDAEEQNMLFAGLSNLVTVRSDVFTVYFRVRSFRQDPVTGIWDALDPEQIVDDSRYVMLVDRSEVNTPSDKPRILYLEKLSR